LNPLHEALTPAERDQCQDWLARRHLQIRWPIGTRRKTDKAPGVRFSLGAWRKRLGISQTELVVRMHGKGHGPLVDIDVIRQIETGSIDWNHTRYLHRIADALGISIDSILVNYATGRRVA
jgi:hypothetical protein